MYTYLGKSSTNPEFTPLNPPLERGETGKSSSLPFARGGLGWGNARTGSDSITCVYTVALQGGVRGGSNPNNRF
ncbi:putative archaeal coiled-coil protein [Nodularia spumigena CCY9414]|nr:putative archaeal coiled-coil protein [Nodularia spumigena CCY9414]